MENKDGGVPSNTGAPAAEVPPVPPVAEVREQDRLMPLANVNRIMRRVLPPHAQISDDAKELVRECASEFISFVTGEANERCHDEWRKTISVHDILWALGNLGFHDYVRPVAAYVQRMRDFENGVVVANANPPPFAGAGPRAPPPAAFVPAAGAGSSQGLMQMQMQMQRGAMYYAPWPAAPVQQQRYAIPAMPIRVRPPFVFRGQHPVAPYYGGEHPAYGEGSSRGYQPMAPYYGGEHPAYGEGSSRGAGDVGDEGSSTN